MTDSLKLFSGKCPTPHHTFPFNDIHVSDVREALLRGMEEENAEVEAIVSNSAQPTFENTVAAFEKSGQTKARAESYMYNMLSACTSDELENLANELSERLSMHSAEIMQNERLFERIRTVKLSAEALTAEERAVVDNIYDSMVRAGAMLSAADKVHYKAIRTELSKLTLTFSQNNLKELNAFQLHLTDKTQLKGLPDMHIEQAAATAKERGLDGWVITLHAPSYVPFMTYADSRELRQKLYTAHSTLCTHDNEYNNFETVRRIVNLRHELAVLLGYKTYADYVLTHRMATDVPTVYGLLHQLTAAYKPQAQREVSAVEQLAQEMEGKDFKLEPWDFAYYSRLLKKKHYDLDADMLRPYFELSAVIKGVFGLATRLYGITFHENKDIPVYHPDVKAYEVFDNDGSFLAVLYADFHPRESKQSGAWMTNYKEESNYTDRPHVAIVMNLTKPTAQQPALLTHAEVETFLHEFGHALHAIFANTRFALLSGTNVFWDFVELPSQFMENFAVEPEFLNTFARHYKTGEPLPKSLIERIVKSRNFNAAYACMRQVSFGLLDMAYYTLEAPLTADVRAFERQAWAEAQLLPTLPDACMTVTFSHIMSGGYAAGYYSYKWAEVLDADAFQYFKTYGIFSKAMARRFRECILSQGGTRPPMKLYRDFRGQAPTIDALLRRNGIEPPTTSQKPPKAS